MARVFSSITDFLSFGLPKFWLDIPNMWRSSLLLNLRITCLVHLRYLITFLGAFQCSNHDLMKPPATRRVTATGSFGDSLFVYSDSFRLSLYPMFVVVDKDGSWVLGHLQQRFSSVFRQRRFEGFGLSTIKTFHHVKHFWSSTLDRITLDCHKFSTSHCS